MVTTINDALVCLTFPLKSFEKIHTALCKCGTIIQYHCLSSTVCSSCRCCCHCAVLFVRCRCAVVISLVMAAVVLSSLLCGCCPLGCPCCRQDSHCRVTCLAVVGIVIGVGLVHSCVAVGVNSRRQDKRSQKNKQVALFVVRARVRAWEAPFFPSRPLFITRFHSLPPSPTILVIPNQCIPRRFLPPMCLAGATPLQVFHTSLVMQYRAQALPRHSRTIGTLTINASSSSHCW